MSSQAKRGSFFYTLLGYLLILLGLLIIALTFGACLYWFVIVPGRMPSEETFRTWIGFIIYTPVIFWRMIKESRPHWRSKMFWWTIVGLVLFHIAFFSMASRYLKHLRTFYVYIIFTVEGATMMAVLDWILKKFGKRHHSKDGIS